ncbi:MAG: hypothetical protein WC563_02365 [Brevundimonas sp.]|jgi:hypothetical protein|uniref:hypothetical protein n=1 Tax=unclassified Brevundimonas TaxID=2622653 RepID=UPI0006F54E3C|nr:MULTISPECIES: hypothetical protein [unclassified Brevundimonas]ANC53794.1 hypothetical protein A4249_09095 [Brevundimonas sp. GW460-12-10-14-LB2]KQP44135.1 hypothetical protein ASF31_12965 [Brevundimonas sp. Leaf280]MEA3472962.1 hypothetical protein [Pseudomonadota bacterium]QIF81270.1 hypothetical protein E4341_05920 [Brevundimonas sp. 'scallop']
MIGSGLRNALSIFSLIVIFGGAVFCLFLLMFAFVQDQSGAAFGRALTKVGPIFFGSVINGGVLRLLISIDARLEQKT